MPSPEEAIHTSATSRNASPAAAPPLSANEPTRVVVVHGGARDNYQLALALQEHGMLEAFVTDLFWPQDAAWARLLERTLPERVKTLLRQRSQVGLPAVRIQQTAMSGFLAHIADRLSVLPFSTRRAIRRLSDARLGQFAGNLARRTGTGLVSYSYYGYQAFRAYRKPAILFQLHPHPETMRHILQQELAEHPECAASLNLEWELALPPADFQRLVDESHSASHYLVASSFTRQSLIDHGVSPGAIDVIPYGVDLQRFRPLPVKAASDATLQLLFVGRINQRKGLSYLLEALKLLAGKDVHLTICGRVVDDLQIFAPFANQVTIRPSVSAEELVLAYQTADLFVFPSVGEGFGQVLLEAIACGLPVLSTTHTAAPDLIEDGVQGFIVEPRRPDLLADRITWALTHREDLAEMGRNARLRAEQFPWTKFRTRCAQAIQRAQQLSAGAPLYEPAQSTHP
ncbi:glycosyltransferase family 4 protein [Terriglobus sp.]|uniref:glycosyltransferase family 4 protein n=1 Tax=Terriglobus sp. TaxID=1889013 RepID=UPI003B002F5F